MENQIERTIYLNAPTDRVWVALTDHEEFGAWFRVSLHDPFKVGEVTFGEVTYPGHEGLAFWVRVEVMDEPRCFRFIWPIDETVQPDDPSIDNKVTLVEVTLESYDKRTRLTVRESGFDKLPEGKRLQVLRNNERGWDAQMKHIKDFVG